MSLPGHSGVARYRPVRHPRRKRTIRDHLGARIGSFTLRRSLAALLKDVLSLVIKEHGGEQKMSRESEARIWITSISNRTLSGREKDDAYQHRAGIM